MGRTGDSPITTKPPPHFDIDMRLPTAAETGSTELVQAVVRMINIIYGEAEKGLWKTDFVRTNVAEVSKWMADGELYLAFDRSGNYPSYLSVIGSVRIHNIEPGITDFGSLTVLRSYRSAGLGGRFVGFAESVAKSRGSSTMQLELIVPRLPQTHPQKEFLRSWYGKIGYLEVRMATVDETVPHLVDSFSGPMDFCVMQKQL